MRATPWFYCACDHADASSARRYRGAHVLRREGTQASVVDIMQTRMQLYDMIDYHDYEKHLDRLAANTKSQMTNSIYVQKSVSWGGGQNHPKRIPYGIQAIARCIRGERLRSPARKKPETL